jgi:hypothetical protein
MKVFHYKFIAIPQMCLGIFLYTIHYSLRELLPIYNKSPIRWYFGDFLALIVCIPIFVNAQIFFKIRKKYYITIVDVIMYFLLFTVYCEIIMPNYKKNMTGDPLDVIAYFFGGILLYFSQKYSFEEKINKKIKTILHSRKNGV